MLTAEAAVETEQPSRYLVQLCTHASKMGGHETGSSEKAYAARASRAAVAAVSRDPVWTSNSGALTPTHPVVLTYDNGESLVFRRTISVDDQYLFSVKDEVAK